MFSGPGHTISPYRYCGLLEMAEEHGADAWNSGVASPLSTSLNFSLLCRVLDPTESETTLWHKIIDRKSCIVLFYQIDHQSIKPKISRCVRLTADRSLGSRETLKPTVFLYDCEQPPSFVETTFGRTYLSSLDELTELLKVIESLDLSHLCGPSDADLDGRNELGQAAQRLNAVLGQPMSSLSVSSAPSSSIKTRRTKVEYFPEDYTINDDPGLPQMGEDDTSSVYSHPDGSEAAFDIIPKLQEGHKNEDEGMSPPPHIKKESASRKRKESAQQSSTELEESPAKSSKTEKNFYWVLPGRDRVPLRTGYDVYIYSNVLGDLKKTCGPDKQPSWHKYARELVRHLVGSWENILKNKKHRSGVEKYIGDGTCHAIVGHLEEVFQVELTKKEFVQRMNNCLCYYKDYHKERN